MANKKVTKKQVKGAKKTKTVKKMQQTHGKAEGIQPSTLDEVWGDTGLSRYGTLSEEEYTTKVSEYNKSDLQTHATSVGVVPVENRVALEKKLVKEFQKHTARYNKPAHNPKQIELSEKVRKILAEGK